MGVYNNHLCVCLKISIIISLKETVIFTFTVNHMKPSLEIPRCIKLKILSLKLFILLLELLILLNVK